MEVIIPLIVPFIGRGSYILVSKGWKNSIDKINRSIMNGAKNRYPKAITVYEIFKSIIVDDNIHMMKLFTSDYTGYLPISVLHLISYIRSRNMTLLLMKLTNYDKELDILRRMIDIYDLYTPEYMKITSSNKIFDDLNMINRYDLLDNLPRERIMELFNMELDTEIIIPMKLESVKWLLDHNCLDQDAEIIVKDDMTRFPDIEDNVGEEYLFMLIGLFDAEKIFKYEIELYLDDGNWVLMYSMGYYHSKILDLILENESSLKLIFKYMISGLDRKDKIIQFEYLYRIIEHGIPDRYMIQALAIAMRNGWIEILDRWLNTKNIIPVVAFYYQNVISYSYMLDEVHHYLAYRGMHPSWFHHYSESNIPMPKNIDPKLWLQYLPNLVLYTEGNTVIIERIITLHRKKIGPKTKEGILAFLDKNSVIDNAKKLELKETILAILILSKTIPESKDMLYFFSGSADKKPGKGVNEQVEDISQYSELAKMKDWRRELSNFAIGDFKYKNPINDYISTYHTAEHAYHAIKISLANPEKAKQFSLESGSILSRGDGNAARNVRKIVLLSGDQLQQWGQMKDKVLEDILYAKFSQVRSAREILLATGRAQLWHGAPRTSKTRQFALERVRDRVK